MMSQQATGPRGSSDHALRVRGGANVQRRSRRRLRIWWGVGAALALLALYSWWSHIGTLERHLALEATETVYLADALTLEMARERPGDPASGRTPLPPRLPQVLAVRLRPPAGYSRLHSADGRVLLARGGATGLPALVAAREARELDGSGWLEARTRSSLTGVSSVSGVSLVRALQLWIGDIAVPGLLLLAGGVLLAIGSERLEMTTARLRQASHQARQDALTGLPNRRAFERALERMSRACARDRHPLSAVFIDIDRFKQLNDRHGHAAGDRALRAVASAIRASLLRPTDFCCRWGGEEFVVLLPDTDARGALQTAARILEAVRGLHVRLAEGHREKLTVSAGIATHSDSSAQPDHELIRDADAAMLEAKRGGRDRWVMWRPPQGDSAAPAADPCDSTTHAAAGDAPTTPTPAPAIAASAETGRR